VESLSKLGWNTKAVPPPNRRAPADLMRTAPCVGLCCAEGESSVPHHTKIEREYRARVAKGRA
jgi:hypothetical protein